MYTMKQVCSITHLPYETLKFYCNEGLIPNVKRASNNYRVFDEHDLKWIQRLSCLKSCGMSIAKMKEYLLLCLQGEITIPERIRSVKSPFIMRQDGSVWSPLGISLHLLPDRQVQTTESDMTEGSACT